MVCNSKNVDSILMQIIICTLNSNKTRPWSFKCLLLTSAAYLLGRIGITT